MTSLVGYLATQMVGKLLQLLARHVAMATVHVTHTSCSPQTATSAPTLIIYLLKHTHTYTHTYRWKRPVWQRNTGNTLN